MGKVIPEARPKFICRVVMHDGRIFTGAPTLDAPEFAAKVLSGGYTEQLEGSLRVWPASAVKFVEVTTA